MKRDVVRSTVKQENFERLGRVHYSVKSAFLHPNDPTARFPQHQRPRYIDFRSETIEPFKCPVRSTKWKKEREPDPMLTGMDVEGATSAPQEAMDLRDLRSSLATIERKEVRTKVAA
jgi:hypothetical protein